MYCHLLKSAVTALCLVFVIAPARADESTHTAPEAQVSFAADRPGYGDATTTVPPFRLALEAGSALLTSDDGLALELPQLLLRYGLTGWLELRVQVPGLDLPVSRDGVPAGTDGGVGFKLAVAPHARVGLSFVSTFGVPVTALAEGEHELSWSGSLNAGVTLSDSFTLNATASAALTQPLSAEESSTLWEIGGAIGVSGAFDSSGLYLEGIAVADQDGALRLALGLGLTQMLTSRLQLDLSFDYDLPEFGSTIRVGVGVATLF
ncbi:MAG: transporter [Myxococcota bacterium]